MILRKILRIIIVPLLVFVSGCAEVTGFHSVPDITFSHFAPYRLSALSLKIESNYRAPMIKPYVEHKLDQSPEKVLRQWAVDRLAISGGAYLARFIIMDASVTEHTLDTDASLNAVFTNEQASQYEATVEAMLEIRNLKGIFLAKATARASRVVTTPENCSLNEKEAIIFRLIEQLAQDFNEEMENNILSHLGQWIH